MPPPFLNLQHPSSSVQCSINRHHVYLHYVTRHTIGVVRRVSPSSLGVFLVTVRERAYQKSPSQPAAEGMSGTTPSTHREGPARARALARQRAVEEPESATAWLEGSHLAVVLHPEWQQARRCPVHGDVAELVVAWLTMPCATPQARLIKAQRRRNSSPCIRDE